MALFTHCMRLCCVSVLVVAVLALTASAQDGHDHDDQLADDVLATEGEVVDQAVGDHGADDHAEDHGGVDYNQPPLELKIPLFLFSLILFGAFVLIMRPLVWVPLINGLDAREGRIAKAETDARKARIEVDQLTAQAEKRLAEVQEQVRGIVAQARAEAESRKMEIISQAEQDAQRIKREALEAIAQARAEALQELEQTVDAQVALATEHVAGRRL